MEKLKNSIKKFQDIRRKYAYVGAYDSEINYIFRKRLKHYIDSTYIKLPKDQKEWQLFNEEDSYTAAQELSFGLLGVIVVISKIQRYASDVERNDAMKYLESEVL